MQFYSDFQSRDTMLMLSVGIEVYGEHSIKYDGKFTFLSLRSINQWQKNQFSVDCMI